MPKHFRHFTNTKQFRNYGNDAKSKWDFSLVLKVCREFDDVASAGKLFQVRAAATVDAPSPKVDSRDNADVDDDRRRYRPGILATGWMASAR